MLTKEQLLERRKGIGASEVAAWLGLDPERTLAECVYDKRGLLPVDDSTNDAAEFGSEMEIPLARMFERRNNCVVVRPPAPYIHAGGIIRANLDWQMTAAQKGNAPVECKWTTAAVDTWGDPEEGENALPKKVLLQATAQMVCAESDVGHIIAALNRFGRVEFRQYEIRRNDRLAAAIVARLSELWERHVVNGEPLPDGSPVPDGDVLKRLERVPKSVAVIRDPAEVMEWKRLKDEAAEAEKKAKAARDAVLLRFGTAEALYGPENQLLATYYATKDKEAFDLERFRQDNPALAAKYTTTKPGHRVLLCKIKEA